MGFYGVHPAKCALLAVLCGGFPLLGLVMLTTTLPDHSHPLGSGHPTNTAVGGFGGSTVAVPPPPPQSHLRSAEDSRAQPAYASAGHPAALPRAPPPPRPVGQSDSQVGGGVSLSRDGGAGRGPSRGSGQEVAGLIEASENVMSRKAHGTCATSPKTHLRWVRNGTNICIQNCDYEH